MYIRSTSFTENESRVSDSVYRESGLGILIERQDWFCTNC